MLKEQSTIIRRLVIGVDALLLAVVFLLAFLLRFRRFPGPDDLWRYGWIAAAFVVFLLFSLYRQRLYHQLRFLAVFEVAKKTLAAFGVPFALAAALLFLSHATYYSRLLFLYFSCGSLAVILASKIGLKLFLLHLRRQGYNFRQALVVGSGEKLTAVEDFFRRHDDYGIKVIAAREISALDPERFAALLREHVVDEVYFACDRHREASEAPGGRIDDYLDIAEQAGKTSKVLLNINEGRHSSCSFGRLGEHPMVVLHPVNLDPDQMLLKRLLDIAGGVVGLGLNLLFFPFIAPAIKLDSPGPIFFAQQRVGQNGRLFKLYKYRTMCRDAEAQKQALAAHNEHNGAVFKMTNDPRVTRVGRWLRKISLDEMPQFWNVLKGDMSLVGTRPPTPDEVSEYQLNHYRRLAVKPGITGLWQVSGRNRITDFDDIVALDVKYIDQWSLWLDIRIILKTLVAWCAGR